MDAYDYAQTDKVMSRKVEAIYSDPKRHAFYSCHDASIAEDWRGPRGGKIRGRKQICFHCGGKETGHAETTESL